MPGQALNRRFPFRPPRVASRPWHDASRELQEFLDSLFEQTSGIPGGFLGLTPLNVLVGATSSPGIETDSWMSAGAQLVTAAPTAVSGVGAASSLGSSTTPAREDHQHRLSLPTAQGGLIGFDGANPVALPPPTLTKGAVLVNPTVPTDVIIWRAPWSCTVSLVRGYLEGGTSVTINARRNGASEHLAADLALGPGAWTNSGAVQNTAYVANDSLEIRLKSLVGSPTKVTIQVEFTRP